MSTSGLLSLLSGVRTSGAERWVALCPAHEDHTPSLSLTRRPDKWLVKCWAGCHVVAIVEALGIKLSDLFSDRPAKLDPQAERRRRAGELLEAWRQTHIRRCAEDLRTRDTIIRQIGCAVRDGAITEDDAWIPLAHEYEGYSDVEYRFDRLIRNQDTLELWRKSRVS